MAWSLFLHKNLRIGFGISVGLCVVYASLNVLLGIIPSTTSVREGESDLNTGDNAACKETSDGIGTKEGT